MRQGLDDIVGVWEVHAPDAPFPWHMMTFTPYGTMSQTNPPEGNQNESDSSGQGVWQLQQSSDGRHTIIGKFIEFKADKKSGKYVGKGKVSFKIITHDGQFEGEAEARTYNTDGKQIGGPVVTTIAGVRLQYTLEENKD